MTMCENLPSIEGIVAVSTNCAIADSNGNIPWDSREDRLNFRSLTIGNCVIMGRVTWEQVGILPGRLNIVLSKKLSTSDKHPLNVYIESTLIKAILRGRGGLFFPVNRIFIIGGASVYEQTMDWGIVDTWHITWVNETVRVPRCTFYGIRNITERNGWHLTERRQLDNLCVYHKWQRMDL